MKKKITITFALLALGIIVHGQLAIGVLDINNVHCNVSSTGDLFNRFDDETLPGFEVPAGSGLRTLYAGNLWIGGRSLDQTLKLAAEMYQENGQDWFNGPLSEGSAEISEETQLAYNQVWVANSADVQTHVLYYNLLTTGQDPSTIFPNGYMIPDWFNNWPAHGDVTLDQSFFLAQFFDYNSNGLYDPGNGDYPMFCGDKCVYFIINDRGGIHTESGGESIGLEIHGMLYGFHSDENDMLNNTVFVKYKIINRGSTTLTDTYAGLWLDFDLGNPNDDYVATDVQNGTVYAYNGDSMDETSSIANGYESDLPIQGLVMLQGPRLDADEMDNPIVQDVSEALLNLGIPYEGLGIGYGDGPIDNERLGLTNSMYFLNSLEPISGAPQMGSHYYNYLRSIWKNGSELSYGGDGYDDSEIQAKFVYPGESDPLFWGTAGTEVSPWSELTAENPPGDRMMTASVGPFTLEPGAVHPFDAAFVFARESDSNLDGVNETFHSRVVEARQYFNEFLVDCDIQPVILSTSEVKGEMAIDIYPNPVSDLLNVRIPFVLKDAMLNVYDVTGKMVMQEKMNSITKTIDLIHMPAGIYAIVIAKDSVRLTSKVVKK